MHKIIHLSLIKKVYRLINIFFIFQIYNHIFPYKSHPPLTLFSCFKEEH